MEENNYQPSQPNQPNQPNQPVESKAWLGALLGVLLGLIGLLIGVLMYKDGSYERQTFIKGWLIAFFVALGVEVVLFVIIYLTCLAPLALFL